MRSDPKTIQILLTGDEDSAEFRAAAAELERSPDLQARLEAAAIESAPWWDEARRSLREEDLPTSAASRLSNSVVIEVAASLPGDDVIDYERVPLDFLGPATHPELLGRLGRYDIEAVIGTGGMGVVLRGYDSELHRIVAIKILAPHLAHHASARRRFAREAQAAAAVVHPHIIPIHNVECDGQLPYLVMQYVPGQSLQARVDSQGPLAVIDTLRIAQQTASALSAAHAQGLVHRDVKPANILLEDRVERVLLSDFGLARAVDDASLTRTGIVAGTPDYMSPEQARGTEIDHRSDLFSLGSVIYFMLTGRPPFRADGAMAVLHRICDSPHRPLNQINCDVPIELCDLVDRLLSKQPARRFRTADQAEQALNQLLVRMQRGELSVRSRRMWKTRSLVSRPGRVFLEAFRGLPRYAQVLSGGALILLVSLLVWSGFQLMNAPLSEPVSNGTGISERESSPSDLAESATLDPAEAARARALLNEFAGYDLSDQEFSQAVEQMRTELSRIEQDWRSSAGFAQQPDGFTQDVQSIDQQLQRMAEELNQ